MSYIRISINVLLKKKKGVNVMLDKTPCSSLEGFYTPCRIHSSITAQRPLIYYFRDVQRKKK